MKVSRNGFKAFWDFKLKEVGAEQKKQQK